MITAHSKSEIENFYREKRKGSHSVGLVPTMGALHDGHISLVKKSVQDNPLTIVSLFVNPLQFNDPSDYKKYPNTRGEDLKLLQEAGADCVYIPDVNDFYNPTPVISISFGPLETAMEGKFRPGHFSGVGVVVSKLFHHVEPDRAYFGMKDLQQFLLIKRMVKDLSFNIEIIPCETIREPSGLAMSSRNMRLSDHGREIASNIYKGLIEGEHMVRQKDDPDRIKGVLQKFYADVEGLSLEYIEIVEGENLGTISNYHELNSVAICIAAYVENVRLIDNLYLQFN